MILNETNPLYTNEASSDDPIPIPPISFLDLNLVQFLAMITVWIINAVFIIINHNLNIEVDVENVTPEDFALLISNVHVNVEQKQDYNDGNIQNLLKQKLNIDGICPKLIIPTYDIEEFAKLKNQFIATSKQHRYCLREKVDFYKTGGCCSSTINKHVIEERYNNLNSRLEKYIEKIESGFSDHQNDMYICIFKNSDESETYLRKFSPDIFSKILDNLLYIMSHSICRPCFSEKNRKFYSKKISLRVERAPEPSDIIWENLKYRPMQKFFRSISVYCLTIVYLGICCVIFYCFNLFQKFLSKNSSEPVQNFIAFVFSMIVRLSNEILKDEIGSLTK